MDNPILHFSRILSYFSPPGYLHLSSGLATQFLGKLVMITSTWADMSQRELERNTRVGMKWEASRSVVPSLLLSIALQVIKYVKKCINYFAIYLPLLFFLEMFW
jgi:hypothetical protein